MRIAHIQPTFFKIIVIKSWVSQKCAALWMLSILGLASRTAKQVSVLIFWRSEQKKEIRFILPNERKFDTIDNDIFFWVKR